MSRKIGTEVRHFLLKDGAAHVRTDWEHMHALAHGCQALGGALASSVTEPSLAAQNNPLQSGCFLWELQREPTRKDGYRDLAGVKFGL